jgi:hypothetical protein
MERTPRTWAASAAILAALGLVVAGCGEDKKPESTTADAGAETGPQKPVLGGKLGAAVKAAESAQAAAPSQANQGPPENGYFPPGEADKAHAPNAPPKVELLGDGAAPKAPLAAAPGDDEQRETVTVGIRQSAQSAVINVDYTLALKVDKGKDDKGKDDKKPSPPRSVRVAGTIAAVAPAPSIPKEVGDQLAKIKGTEIHYTLGANGVVSDVGYTLAKGADQGVDPLVRALADTLALAAPPLPDKPVGVGAYWMVTDRATTLSGVDVVRYRVYRVESMENGRAVLSVDIRQYATKAEVEAGRGQRVGIDRFDSQGKGKVEWAAAALLPTHGDLNERMQLAVHIASGQQGMAMAELQARMAKAEDKKK